MKHSTAKILHTILLIAWGFFFSFMTTHDKVLTQTPQWQITGCLIPLMIIPIVLLMLPFFEEEDGR